MQPVERSRQAEKDLLQDLSKDTAEKGQTKFDLVLASLQRLLRRGAINNIGKMLGRMHPADIDKLIVHLSSPKEKRTVVELVRGEARGAQAVSELDIGGIQQLLADILPADGRLFLKEPRP